MREDFWFIILSLYLIFQFFLIFFFFFLIFQFISVAQSCPILWTAARQSSLPITNSWTLLKLMSIKLVMPSNHLILCHSHRVDKVLVALASVLQMNIQDRFPLGLTGLILKSKGLSRFFSNTTVQKHQLFSMQLSLQSNLQDRKSTRLNSSHR